MVRGSLHCIIPFFGMVGCTPKFSESDTTKNASQCPQPPMRSHCSCPLLVYTPNTKPSWGFYPLCVNGARYHDLMTRQTSTCKRAKWPELKAFCTDAVGTSGDSCSERSESRPSPNETQNRIVMRLLVDPRHERHGRKGAGECMGQRMRGKHEETWWMEGTSVGVICVPIERH